MSLSEYTDQGLLNSLFGKTSNFGALGSAPTVYVGLSTTTPSPDGTGVTEPSTGSYARVATAASGWTPATLANPSLVQNGATITFPTATGTWSSGSNMTYVVLYDAATSGNFLGFGVLSVAQPVMSGNVASFAIDALQVTLA